MQNKRGARYSRFVNLMTAVVMLCIVGACVGIEIILVGQPTVDNNSSIELAGTRGAHINFSIRADPSIHGLWEAPNGLQLRLSNDEINYSQELEALGRTFGNWGNDLTVTNGQALDTTNIEMDFALPDDIPDPQTQTLQGEITGTIVIPVPVSSDQFDNVERNIAVSLKIHLAQVTPVLDYIRYNALFFGLALEALSITTAFVMMAIAGKWGPRVGIPDVAVLKTAADSKGLLRALRYKDASVRQAAAHALGEMHSYPALRPLIGALRDQDSKVRIAAARALAEIGDGRATEALSTAAATDSDAAVRVAATAALARLPKQ
jgi:hypothetical protein